MGKRSGTAESASLFDERSAEQVLADPVDERQAVVIDLLVVAEQVVSAIEKAEMTVFERFDQRVTITP